jgi:signal transduction histidine kinase
VRLDTVGLLRRFLAFPRTLRTRLALASGGSILVAVAVFAAVTIALVNHQLRSSLDAALRVRAQEVAQLAVSAPAVLTDPGALESPVSGRQIAVEVLDARGRIVARSQTLGARLLPPDALARSARLSGRTGYEDLSLSGRRFRLYAAPIAQGLGGPAAGGAVLVASDTTDIVDTIDHLGFVLAVAGAVVALLAALTAGVLTRRGLRPLRRLAGAAEEIERTGDPARRLPGGPLGARPAEEIAQLAGVLNRMLASLERSGASERRFLADASHELRTPVTTLLGNVDYAARHGVDDELLSDLQRDTLRLARLVDDLLVLEREGARMSSAAPVALDRIVREVADELNAGAQRVEVSALAPAPVTGEEDALRRVVGNLIDNALVHGPDGATVHVELRAADGRARLTVRDEGPGPDPAQHERLFERFWRGPDSSGRPGSGLGLSIVAAIVERHGGRVTVEGSAFTVDLPVGPADP